MNRDSRLAGRNAAPPAAGSAARSDKRDGKRSMLDSFRSLRSFGKSCIPDLVLASQVKVLSRLKGLKTPTKTVNASKDAGQLTSPLLPQLLASPRPTSGPQLSELVSQRLNSVDTGAEGSMHPPIVVASQKRKQPLEHDDTPCRTTSKSRPTADDPEKRHIVQQWVDRQEESVSPTTVSTSSISGAGRRDLAPATCAPSPDGTGGLPYSSGPASQYSTASHGLSTASYQPQPQAATFVTQPLVNDERRGSTATTTNMTYRDSTFSSCPSVATGLTSTSEISLVLTGRRLHTESRSSSFFSKASPRSSIASSAPSPHFFLYRTISSNSAGQFDELRESANHHVPNVPKLDPLRSHPVQTFFGMDLGSPHAAVIIDQVVKMGHLAQERRAHAKPFVDGATSSFDKALLLAATTTAAMDLTPIKETPSDDGHSSCQKMQLDGLPSADTEACTASDSDGKELPDTGLTFRSAPTTPDSIDRLSAIILTDGQTSRDLTPATSVANVSDMSGMVSSSHTDDTDDSLSDITEYTEESLFEAVEAFGPGLSNPLMLSIIMSFKDEVLRLVLARINFLLGDGNGTTQHTNGEPSGSSRGASSSTNSLQNQASANQRNGSRKRGLDGGRGGSEEDNGDDRSKRIRAPAAGPSDLELRYSRLACPFYKRYPEMKWKGACCHGFPSVHRIKEHVYRKHDHPYCPRCHTTFAEEKDKEEHLRANSPCTVIEGPLGHQGITPEQRGRIRSRRNRRQNQPEPEKWVDLYNLLFPEILRDQIPSPYYDLDFKSCEELLQNPATAAAFRRFLVDDVPTRVERQLEERRRLIPGAESDFIQAQLGDIIRSSIHAALDHVPSQLLVRDESTSLPDTQLEPRPSMGNAPDSHNTALIGAQFASAEPTQEPETSDTQEETIPEVTLPDNPEPWVQSQDFGALFNDNNYFPDPLSNSADGIMGTANRQFFLPATAFTAIGYPSAMIAGTPTMSPALPVISFEGFNFADAGAVENDGNLTNMANTSFLFTHDDMSARNGSGAGHQSNQYMY